MADEKKQELSLEDLETVGGGKIVDRPKKKTSAASTTDEESNLRVADGRGHGGGFHVM